jgi:hypothetical protein
MNEGVKIIISYKYWVLSFDYLQFFMNFLRKHHQTLQYPAGYCKQETNMVRGLKGFEGDKAYQYFYRIFGESPEELVAFKLLPPFVQF